MKVTRKATMKVTTAKSSAVLLVAVAALAVAVLLTFATAEGGEIPVTTPEKVGMSTDRLERISAGLGKLIAENKIPGTVTLVGANQNRSQLAAPTRR